MGSWPVLGGYATELFPTAQRGQAGAWSAVAKAGGSAASLGLGGQRVHATGGRLWAATSLGRGPLIGLVMVAVLFPDTHGRELEEISGEDLAVAPPVLTVPVERGSADDAGAAVAQPGGPLVADLGE